jgi:Domain of unknown function (DUF4349)/Putative zinc-finger
MAYVDGELPHERRAVVDAHLPGCSTCQEVVAELQQVSHTMAAWQVENPAGSLRAPSSPAASVEHVPWWTVALRAHSRLMPAAAAAALVVVVVAATRFGAGGTLGRRAVGALAQPERVTSTFGRRGGPGGAGGGGGNTFSTSTASPVPADREVTGAVADKVAPFAGRSAVPPPPAASAQEQGQSRGPKIIRTVSLTIVVKDFDIVRPAVDRVLRDVSGYVGQIQVSGARGEGRSLHAHLRVPSERLEEALRSLRGVGQVIDESQSGDDVAEQVMDVEARLANSRNTEKRLTDVLKNRTGKVADVLEVEREISRVRGEIEQLDAQRTDLERRVSYATVTLEVNEQRQASLDIGPLPLSTRLRNALVDGLRDALESTSDVVLWALRVAPTVLVWIVVLWWPVRALMRSRRLKKA